MLGRLEDPQRLGGGAGCAANPRILLPRLFLLPLLQLLLLLMLLHVGDQLLPPLLQLRGYRVGGWDDGGRVLPVRLEVVTPGGRAMAAAQKSTAQDDGEHRCAMDSIMVSLRPRETTWAGLPGPSVG